MNVSTNKTLEVLTAIPDDGLLRSGELDECWPATENAPPCEGVDGDAEKFGSLARGIETRRGDFGRIVLHGHDRYFLRLARRDAAPDHIAAMSLCAASSILERPS